MKSNNNIQITNTKNVFYVYSRLDVDS